MFESAKVFRDALHVMAEDYPDSFLAELLVHFDVAVIAKLIYLYGGQMFHIPNKDNVWRNYRNKIVRKTLDLRDDKAARKELARFFGISYPYVLAIYRKEKERYPEANFTKIDTIVRKLYKKKCGVLYKEMTELFLRKL